MKGSFHRAGENHREAEQREPQILRMMALCQVERRTQRCHADKQKTHHDACDDVLIPSPASDTNQPVLDIVVGTKLRLVQQSALN